MKGCVQDMPSKGMSSVCRLPRSVAVRLMPEGEVAGSNPGRHARLSQS